MYIYIVCKQTVNLIHMETDCIYCTCEKLNV